MKTLQGNACMSMASFGSTVYLVLMLVMLGEEASCFSSSSSSASSSPPPTSKSGSLFHATRLLISTNPSHSRHESSYHAFLRRWVLHNCCFLPSLHVFVVQDFISRFPHVTHSSFRLHRIFMTKCMVLLSIFLFLIEIQSIILIWLIPYSWEVAFCYQRGTVWDILKEGKRRDAQQQE